jgi:predicted deacylase
VDYEAFERELMNLHAKFPEKMELEVIGHSVEKRNIYKVRIKGDSEPILISAGHHGDEPAGPLAVLDYISEYCETDNNNFDLTIFPLVNPDGYEHDTRTNANGVDLNRDYFEFKQPETRALKSSAASSYFMALDIHEAPPLDIGFYLLESIPKEKDDLELGDQIISQVSKNFDIDEPGVRRTILKGSSRYYWSNLGAYALTFETPGLWKLEDRIKAHKLAIKEALDLIYSK